MAIKKHPQYFTSVNILVLKLDRYSMLSVFRYLCISTTVSMAMVTDVFKSQNTFLPFC